MPKNSINSPTAGVTNATTGRTTLGPPAAGAETPAAEQGRLQFAQGRQRRFEDAQLLLDGGADLRRASDPFADGAGERGRGQCERADRKRNDQEAADPRRNTVAGAGLDQRRQRQRNHCRHQNRQQDFAAKIQNPAQQDEKNADIGRLAGRHPDRLDTADRLRVADDERVSRFAAGADIVHNALRVFRAWPPANFGRFGQICPS